MGKTKILTCILFLSGLLCAQSPNGSILQIQNAGTPIATFTAFGMINCSTGVTCTYSGGKVNITATATGTVTGTGTAGNLVQWTAASALGNANLSGDCTTSGSLALICTKTNGTSFATVATSASASDLSAGTLAVARGGSGVGTLTGIIKGNGTSPFGAALAADVVGLFSGCSGTQYLGADGACHAAGGSAWSAITDPAGDQTLAMGTNKSTWKANSQTFSSFYFDPANGFGFTTDTATGPGTLFTGTAPRNGIEIRNGNATNITSIFTANHTANTGFGVFQAISGTAQTAGGYFRGLANASDVAIGSGIIAKTGTGGTDLMVFKSTGAICGGNNGGCFSSHPTAQFTIEHNTTFDTGAYFLSDVHKPIVTISRAASTSLNLVDSYLHLGFSEFGANSYRAICMGFADQTITNCPAYLAYKETSASGNTFGTVGVFGRLVTTDTAPVRRQEWNLTKTGLTNNTNTSFLDVPASAGSVASGHIIYTVEVDNGTDFQTTTGVVGYACANKAGTMTANVGTATATSSVVTTGTHAVTFASTTGTAKCTIQVNSNSSLTPTTNRINYSVVNLSTGNDISPL